MASRGLPIPYFPSPPDEYSRKYMATVTQAFTVFAARDSNPGEGRNTKLTLTNLQEGDYALEVGALFEMDGFVKVTRSDMANPAGLSTTTEVGTVTVTT